MLGGNMPVSIPINSHLYISLLMLYNSSSGYADHRY